MVEDVKRCPECGLGGTAWRGNKVVANICPACVIQGHWSRMCNQAEWANRIERLHRDGYDAKALLMTTMYEEQW